MYISRFSPTPRPLYIAERSYASTGGSQASTTSSISTDVEELTPTSPNFTVAINEPAAEDIYFDWWIVGVAIRPPKTDADGTQTDSETTTSTGGGTNATTTDANATTTDGVLYPQIDASYDYYLENVAPNGDGSTSFDTIQDKSLTTSSASSTTNQAPNNPSDFTGQATSTVSGTGQASATSTIENSTTTVN